MPITGFESADGVNQPPKLLQEGGEVKRYKVTINGMETELQLTDAEAKARGLVSDEPKAAKAPANKSRGAANKGDA